MSLALILNQRDGALAMGFISLARKAANLNNSIISNPLPDPPAMAGSLAGELRSGTGLRDPPAARAAAAATSLRMPKTTQA